MNDVQDYVRRVLKRAQPLTPERIAERKQFLADHSPDVNELQTKTGEPFIWIDLEGFVKPVHDGVKELWPNSPCTIWTNANGQLEYWDGEIGIGADEL